MMSKILVLDKNMWNHLTMYKLWLLNMNTWNHMTVFKLFVSDKNILDPVTVQLNDYRNNENVIMITIKYLQMNQISVLNNP